MVVPPEATRWFVQGQEMGTDKTMDWWTMEQPPEDDSVQITEYRIDPTIEAQHDDETGDTVLHYTCDDTKWLVPEGTASDEAVEGLRRAGYDTEKLREAMLSDPELRDRVNALASQAGVKYEDPDEIPRAFFSPADIRAILTTSGEWLTFVDGGRMAEVALEPDPENPMKVGLGPMLVVPKTRLPRDDEGDGYMLVSPQAIAAIKMAESSIVGDDELQRDAQMKSLRISRTRFDNPDDAASNAIEQATIVTVVEPDGTLTEAKNLHGE